MSKYYFYKLTVDDGGAPCVENGLLSLAICKPMIRSTADDKENDVIFGFAANSLHPDNRLIYIAKVTRKLEDGKYYKDPKYYARSDCIYEWTGGTYDFRQRRSKFHDKPADLKHDLGTKPTFSRANVLLSEDFRYFGGSLPEHYKKRFPLVAQAIERLRQGHRVHHAPALVAQLKSLLDETWQKHAVKVVGSPTQAPRRGVSHRGGGCGIAVAKYPS